MENIAFAIAMSVSGLIVFPFSFKYFYIERNIFIIVLLSIILGITCLLLPSKLFLVGVGITAVAGALITKHNEPYEVFKAISAVVIAAIPLMLMLDK